MQNAPTVRPLAPLGKLGGTYGRLWVALHLPSADKSHVDAPASAKATSANAATPQASDIASLSGQSCRAERALAQKGPAKTKKPRRAIFKSEAMALGVGVGVLLLLGACSSPAVGVPLFLPPGCTPAHSAPPGWADRLLGAYADEHDAYAARLRALPPVLARAIGLNATLLAVGRAAHANTAALWTLLGAAGAAAEPVRALGAAARSSSCCGAADRSGDAYASASAVLAHLSRDWAEGSSAARASAALVRLLARYVRSPAHAARARVLVPGAGACGLAVALAAAGYTVEANDSSLLMLRAAQGLLALGRAGAPCSAPLALWPAALADANVRARAAQLRPVRVLSLIHI